MMSNIIAIIGLVFSALSVLFLGAAFVASNRKSKFQDGQDDGGMRGDIKYMRNSVDDLRLDVKEFGRKQDQLGERVAKSEERLARVEESNKSAHKRIDALERSEAATKKGDKQ